MMKPHWAHARFVQRLIFGLFLLLGIPGSFSQAQAVMPITPSGLHTTVSAPISVPSGQTQFDITGGTRPGGGANLFHSFGDFNVPNNNIANFLNETALPTSNILGRVTGGNISNIFGTIQTTGFGNANLFLINPAGFLFGANATLNVGGIVTFTSADYVRLADGARFNAIPKASADALLSAAPVAAFGFLGSHPGAITVQGSQLTVADGTGLSLVGGNITVQTGTLTAPSGQINLVSVGKPSHPNVGGEVVVAGSGQGSGFIPTGFKNMGAISLAQGSTVNTSAIAGSAQAAGGVLIRGGQFVMDASAMTARSDASPSYPPTVGGNIEVTAEHVNLSNHSTIDTNSQRSFSATASPGSITFNVNTFSATDSAIVTSTFVDGVGGGSVTIQGLQGSGTSAHAVFLTNTGVLTGSYGEYITGSDVNGGAIVMRAHHIALNQSRLDAYSERGTGGAITLLSNGGLEIRDSSLDTHSGLIGSSGGTVDLQAGTGIHLTDTIIDAHTFNGSQSGTILMAAPFISIRGSTLDVSSLYNAPGGTISLTGRIAVSLTNGTTLSADNFYNESPRDGGSIHINGGALVTSQQSTISAGSLLGHGGIIDIGSKGIVSLQDTVLTTSVSGGAYAVGGSISVDAKHVTLRNSQILSTASEGQGGTIGITTPVFRSTGSMIDATSQFGTNGTVTIHP